MFEKMQNWMESVLSPLAYKLSNNKSISALQSGMMQTMPITLGVSVITILSNLPITPWTNFLTNIGLYATCQYMMMATLNLLAIYIVMAVIYKYATNEGENGLTVAILSSAAFIALMPQMITVGEKEYIICLLIVKACQST